MDVRVWAVGRHHYIYEIGGLELGTRWISFGAQRLLATLHATASWRDEAHLVRI